MKTKALLLILLMFTTTWTLSAQDISSGLVTYFDMETSINNVVPNNTSEPPKDMSGLGNNPTNRGSGTKGFNYMDISDAAGLSFRKVMTSEANVPGHVLTKAGVFNRGKGDYTIALWIYIEDTEFTDVNGVTVPGHKDFQFLAYDHRAAQVTPNAETQTLARLKDGKFAALTTNPGDIITAPNTIIWSKWYHYAVVSEFSTHMTKLFVNGELVAQKQIQNEDVIEVASADGGIMLRRGGGGNMYYYDGLAEGLDSVPANATYTVPTQRLIFKGMMDEFRVYNRALTTEEVVAVMKVNQIPNAINETIDKGIKVYESGNNRLIVESENPVTIAVYNSVGALMLKKNIDTGAQTIDLKHNGLYFIEANGKAYKVIVK